MRVRIVAAVLLAMSLAGCSLLLSTDDLGGDQPPAPDAATTSDAPTGDDGAGDATTGTNDAPSDVTTEETAAADPSLVGFWKMDSVNASLIIADETGHGHDMVLTANTLDATAGLRGGALVFAGSSDSARVFTLENDNFPKTGTLSIWFTRAWVDNDTDTGRGLFDNWDNTRSHLFVRRVNTNGPGEIQLALQPQSSSYTWGGNGVFVTKDAWAHLVITWDSVGAQANAYLDGTVKVTGAFQSTPFAPSQQIFRIGEYWDGKVDEVRIYDRVLSPTEVSMIP